MGTKFRYAARLQFSDPDPSTNNTTEYEALLLGLQKMKALGHPVWVGKLIMAGMYGLLWLECDYNIIMQMVVYIL